VKKKIRLFDESRDAAAAQLLRLDKNHNNNNALVAQPGREKVVLEREGINNKIVSPSRDLNPGPKVFATFPNKERGITKPSLLNSNLS
jgi:hypothetical protein